MTIKEAMAHYNLSERSIRAKLANGILVGEKVPVPTGGLMWNNIREVSTYTKTSKPVDTVLPDKNKVIAELFLQDKITYEQLKEMLGMTPKVAENGLIKADEHNWIFIGDLHEPFTDPRYFDFILNIVNKYKIDKVVFMGDEIDNHAISYHEKDPNGYGIRQEYDLAVLGLEKWFKAFPNSDVLTGNHSSLIKRQVKSAGLLNDWVKPLNDLYKVPTWKFHTEFETDKFVCGHGDDGKNLKTKILHWGKSYIQGHYHSESNLFFTSENHFGLQVGCGVDKTSYAFKYAGKGAKRFIHSAGTYIEGNPGLLTMK